MRLTRCNAYVFSVAQQTPRGVGTIATPIGRASSKAEAELRFSDYLATHTNGDQCRFVYVTRRGNVWQHDLDGDFSPCMMHVATVAPSIVATIAARRQAMRDAEATCEHDDATLAEYEAELARGQHDDAI